MAGGRGVETSPLIFVFRVTSDVHRESGQARIFSVRGFGFEAFTVFRSAAQSLVK